MGKTHIIAVFKAEYYTTTAKFRSYRSQIPIAFLIGIIIFSFILRFIFDLFRGTRTIGNPPIMTFFAIISIFSYFTLFAPILSPVGRVVYNGGAKSRREVALSSPIKSKDLLYGNLLSNLAFFLPFFSFIGTLSLAPFIGNGKFNPLLTVIFLFVILSLLIVLGLVTGTLISPLIFNFIGKQKNEILRAFITISVSIMMMISLPLLRYLLDNANQDGSNLGMLLYLPFILAGTLIIYVLYGIEIGINPLIAMLILVTYVIIIFLIGWKSADYIYGLNIEETAINQAKPNAMINQVVNKSVSIIPTEYRTSTSALLKASLRDVEHISRLTIGLAVTVFLIFALSTRGLFRGVQNFQGSVEQAVVIFSLILSSASVVFIEASAFTVQHRDMFALIKSAPSGPRKFIIGKTLQMSIFLIPVYLVIILIISILDFIPFSSLPFVFLSVSIILFTLISISLAIYLINPSDNEEDLTNFINLLIFYVLAFILGIIPVATTIANFSPSIFQIFLFLFSLLVISSYAIYLAIRALDEMDLETMDSPRTIKIHKLLKLLLIILISWNIIPLLALPLIAISQNIEIFLLVSIIMSSSLPIYLSNRNSLNLFGAQNRFFVRSNFSTQRISATLIAIISMFMVATSLLFLLPQSNNNTVGSAFQSLNSLGISQQGLILIVFVSIIVEEIIFRGFIVVYGEQFLNQREIMIFSSLLFGLIHPFLITSLINAFIQGIILVKLRLHTNSLIHPIIAHLTYNFILITLLSV